ncbi:hypothetical protein KY289_008410 [Solanum tuberosum]|nr:hypothetical protein KY289_008410 [Solanum tuberosum]
MDNLRSRCRVFLADAIEASAGLDIALLRRLALWFSKLPRKSKEVAIAEVWPLSFIAKILSYSR